ncbi:MAG: hypothetical protein LBS10_07570 [Gracilibacteraceae bacterium]|nr:hypothetical protein [Gracilibacteraceae bacterium]
MFPGHPGVRRRGRGGFRCRRPAAGGRFRRPKTMWILRFGFAERSMTEGCRIGVCSGRSGLGRLFRRRSVRIRVLFRCRRPAAGGRFRFRLFRRRLFR